MDCIDPDKMGGDDRCDANAARECLGDVYTKLASPYSTGKTICL